MSEHWPSGNKCNMKKSQMVIACCPTTPAKSGGFPAEKLVCLVRGGNPPIASLTDLMLIILHEKRRKLRQNLKRATSLVSKPLPRLSL